MKIRSFAHKGLKRLYEDDNVKGVPPDSADKLRKMLAFLDVIEDVDELRALTAWKAHPLTGDRKGTWSFEHYAQSPPDVLARRRVANL